VTSKQFTRTLGKVLKRPAFAKIPSFGPKALLGAELVQNLLLNGQRVTPSVLQKDGYEFAHPELEMALRALLSRP
jgi:NAD dependent epimerase/dehydratase family enzyme